MRGRHALLHRNWPIRMDPLVITILLGLLCVTIDLLIHPSMRGFGWRSLIPVCSLCYGIFRFALPVLAIFRHMIFLAHLYDSVMK